MLAYPFYSRRQDLAAVDQKLDAFYRACVDKSSARDYLAETKNCSTSRERLEAEAFPPDTNAYQWFVRPRSGRIWLLFDETADQKYMLEFLEADIKKPQLPYLASSIVFPAAIVLPPLFFYYLLIGGVALVVWIARGFTSQPSSNDSN